VIVRLQQIRETPGDLTEILFDLSSTSKTEQPILDTVGCIPRSNAQTFNCTELSAVNFKRIRNTSECSVDFLVMPSMEIRVTNASGTAKLHSSRVST
jgi:hypothetical protein